MNKFEKLIEYIINDEDQKARDLFHDIVVEKSRDIYESIMDEESMGETVHGEQVEDMVDEISHDESHTMEDEEEFSLDHEDDGEDDGEVAGDFPADSGEEAEHKEIEDQVMNIDAKLDELLAKFDEIMGDEGHGEEMPAEEPGMDHGGEGHEEMSDEEPAMFEGENPFAKSGKSGKSGSAVSGKSGSAASGKSGKSGKGSAELMREYVDRIGDIYGGEGDAAEGDAVGAAGKKVSVNTKSEVGPGADFGGTPVKATGPDSNQDGTSPTKANNEYTKGEGKLIGDVGNTPGGDKKLKSTGDEYSKEHPADGTAVGNDGKISQNHKSVQKQNTGKK